MRALISAYSCAPDQGSEPGAGYAIVRAAAQVAECWVLTRRNNVTALEEAIERDPPPNPIHLVGLDVSDRALRWKRRLGAVRPYYYLWQRTAARVATDLERSVGPFDVVHHATMSAFWMPVGVARLNRPLVLGPLSGGTLTPRGLRRFLGPRRRVSDFVRTTNVTISGAVRRRLFRRADVVIAQNDQMKRFVEACTRGQTRRPVLTHSHASDPVVTLVSARTRRPFALFAGRLVTWKGLLLALEAFQRIDLPDARLIIVGDGPDRGLIESRIAGLGLSSRVEMRGSLPRSAVLELMAESSCLLFPSFHDSAGFVVSEALSLGTPVICLDHGGPGAIVKLWPNVPSEAIPPGRPAETVADLARALERRLGDPTSAGPSGQNAAVTLVDVVSRVYSQIGLKGER